MTGTEETGTQNLKKAEKTRVEHKQLPEKTGRINIKAPFFPQDRKEHVFIEQHVVLAGC